MLQLIQEYNAETLSLVQCNLDQQNERGALAEKALRALDADRALRVLNDGFNCSAKVGCCTGFLDLTLAGAGLSGFEAVGAREPWLADGPRLGRGGWQRLRGSVRCGQDVYGPGPGHLSKLRQDAWESAALHSSEDTASPSSADVLRHPARRAMARAP